MIPRLLLLVLIVGGCSPYSSCMPWEFGSTKAFCYDVAAQQWIPVLCDQLTPKLQQEGACP